MLVGISFYLWVRIRVSNVAINNVVVIKLALVPLVSLLLIEFYDENIMIFSNFIYLAKLRLKNAIKVLL